MFVLIVNPSLSDKKSEKSEYLMKSNNNTSIYSNYKITDNPPMFVTVLSNNKSRYVTMDEIKIKCFRRLNISLKSIFINLYVQVLSFKDTSIITTPTTSTSTTTIAVAAETTTFDPTTTTTTTTNNNNKTYFIKISGIFQVDPMEGFPQYLEVIE